MFTKNDSNICKGIAIVLMLFHHLYYDPTDYEGFIVNYSPFSETGLITLSMLGKVCVAIFVFVSAYGVSASYRKKFAWGGEEPSVKDLFTFTWSRLWNLLTVYWFAFALVLIFQPLGRTFFDAYGTDVKSAIVYFIIDLLGLATLFSTPTLNPTWWYMTIAIIIIISIPLIMRLMERFGAFIIITAFLSILFLFGVYNAYVNYMFTILLGAACLKNDFFTRFISAPMDEDSKKRNRPVKAVKGIVSIAALFALLIVRVTYNTFGIIDGLVALFVVVVSILLISHIPVISRAFSELGRYSANIFLVHTLIYCYYFPEFIYSFASAGWWLSLIVLVLVSFGVSVLMEWIKKVTRYDKMMSAAGNKILGIICEVFK